MTVDALAAKPQGRPFMQLPFVLLSSALTPYSGFDPGAEQEGGRCGRRAGGDAAGGGRERGRCQQGISNAGGAAARAGILLQSCLQC